MTEVGDIVTQVRERWSGNPFHEVLARPGALRFSAAGFVGRMPISMFGLGTVLLIAAMTGRYGLAGTVAAVGSIGYAICAPWAARLADRFGQGRVLRPMVLVFAATTIMLIFCAELRAPVWTLLLSGGLAGASMPSLGSMVRARWSALLGDSPLLHTAFSLESVLDEVIFIVGPAVVTLLATEVYPAAGVAVAMAACVAGTLLFAAQRGTEPPTEPRPAGFPPSRPHPARPEAVGPRPAGAAPAEPPPAEPPPAEAPPAEAPPAEPSAGPPARRNAARASWIAAPGLVTLVPVCLCLGAMFGTIDLSTVAFAQQHGHKPLAGLILGSYALGSAVGGLWYGSRTWHTPVHRRFAGTLCAVTAGTATFWAMPGLAVLAVVIFCSGLAISPMFISGFSLVEQQAPAQRRTEGLAWLTSAISVGVAAGSAVAGRIIDVSGARWGYVFAAGCGGGAAAACLLGLRRLRPAQWRDEHP